MQMRSIVENNPIHFIVQFIEAIQDGYAVENSNRGWVSEGTLKEINLYKNKDAAIYEDLGYGEFVISDYNTQQFLYKLQGAVLQKAEVDIESLYWDSTGLKSVKVSRYAPKCYTREELMELDWELLKAECKKLDITGRDRTLLVNRYMKAMGVE